MYKLAIKFLIITLALTGICLAFSSNGKALAASCPVGDSVPANWGNGGDGMDSNVMSSLVLRARDESGNPLNPHFTLHSAVPGGGDQAQIYRWPVGSGGSVSNTDTWPQQGDFQIGSQMTGDGGTPGCSGWLAMGPGINGHVGNGWVLNCHSEGGTSIPAKFWFTHLDNPGGQPGRWSMLDASGNTILSDVNAQGPAYQFQVTNGSNTRYTFVWHPDPPPCVGSCCAGSCTPPTPTFDATCNHYSVGGVTHGYMEAVEFNGTTVDTTNGGQNWVTFDQTANGSSPPLDISYQALADVVTITTHVYKWNGSTWVEQFGAGNVNPPLTLTYNCYHAKCFTPTVKGDGPGDPGIVQAGHQYTVSVPIQNDHIRGNGPGQYPNAQTIPSSVGSANFKLTGSGGDHNTGFDLNPGETKTLTFTMTAPNDITDTSISFTPQLGGNVLGDGCTANVRVYQNFDSNLTAISTLNPNTEHPYLGDDYSTAITVRNDSSHNVNIPTTSEFYKLSVGGVKSCVNATSSGGPFASSPGAGTKTTTLSGHCDIPIDTYQAGDQFCAHIHADYTTGYVGPDNGVVFTSGGGDTYNCPHVTNKPYFKAYNSSISARNGLNDTSGACSANATNSGLLAGWNDNFDGPNADRGAGTQLSALALIRITGVASAQTDINRPPTSLTFANTIAADISSDRDAPLLGGNFGATPACTAPPKPKPGATNLAGNPAALPASGNYKYTGNIRLNGGTITGSTAIFVNGDVYLNGPIAYNQAGWSPGHVPSLVLVATGNIYIAPGVTQLDGVYIAQPKNATDGGTIYTCATATTPTSFTVNNSYTACKNQLLVTGAFKARNIKLLRTFGSLRDEEPVAGTPGGSQIGLVWDTAGPPSGPLPAGNCTFIDEPSDPNTWNDNYLCVPASSSLHLAWTHYDNNPDPNGPTGWRTADYLKTHGYPYCTKLDIPADYSHTWYDNELCMDQGRPDGSPLVQFRLNNDPTQYCTTIAESADPDGTWNTSGYFLCEPKAAPPGPAITSGPYTHCENAGVQMTLVTCAAEVFRFSPELYLTEPAILPPSLGATQYDAITSLPPVL